MPKIEVKSKVAVLVAQVPAAALPADLPVDEDFTSRIKCSICYDTLRTPVFQVVPCSHKFCETCIKTWRYTHMNKACPMCAKKAYRITRDHFVDTVLEKYYSLNPGATKRDACPPWEGDEPDESMNDSDDTDYSDDDISILSEHGLYGPIYRGQPQIQLGFIDNPEDNGPTGPNIVHILEQFNDPLYGELDIHTLANIIRAVEQGQQPILEDGNLAPERRAYLAALADIPAGRRGGRARRGNQGQRNVTEGAARMRAYRAFRRRATPPPRVQRERQAPVRGAARGRGAANRQAPPQRAAQVGRAVVMRPPTPPRPAQPQPEEAVAQPMRGRGRPHLQRVQEARPVRRNQQTGAAGGPLRHRDLAEENQILPRWNGQQRGHARQQAGAPRRSARLQSLATNNIQRE